MKNNLISVIVPCYNVEPFLEDLFQSLKEQTYKNFEVIFVNDGSTDNTLQKLEGFCQQDKRFKVLSQTNQGVSNARNYGISKAGGGFITFVDADDMYAPNHLECLHTLIEKYNSDLAINQRKFVRENFHFKDIKYRKIKQNEKLYNGGTSEYLSYFLAKKWGFGVLQKLYRMSILKKFPTYPQVFNPKNNYGEDIEFNVKYLQLIKNVVYLNQPFYYHRNRSGSLVKSGFKQNKLGVFIGIDEALRLSENKYPQIEIEAKSCKSIFCMEMLFRMGKSKYQNENEIKSLYSFLKENKKYVFRCKKNNIFQRIFFCWSIPYVKYLNRDILKKSP